MRRSMVICRDIQVNQLFSSVCPGLPTISDAFNLLHVACGYLCDIMYATTASSSADSRGVAGMGCFGVVIKSLSLSAVMLGRAAIALKLGTAAPCTMPPMA